MEFNSQKILISGGSTGIGFATAKKLISLGAETVFITGRNLKALESAAKSLGEKCVPLNFDVSDISKIDEFSDILAKDGVILDVIIANAGIAKNNEFGKTEIEMFDETFDINVRGLFFFVQKFINQLKDGGNIVLTSSICNFKGMANLSVYNASKAAVRSFARSWANDLSARKIRVNSVSPGVTYTPIMHTGLGMDDNAVEGFKEYLKTAAPAGRMADPEEIANGIAFVASNDASYVNGIDFCIDGGFAQI